MNKEVTIGRWEAVSILITVMCTQIFINMPRLVAEDAGSAGWILVIYTAIIAFILFAVIVKLYSNFEGMDILDICEFGMGGTCRFVTGSILTLHLLFLVSIVLREFSENMKIIDLVHSPISLVTLLFISGMVTASYIGIEGILRVAAIAVPIITLAYFAILIGASQYNDFSNLYPILGFGPYELFVKGLSKVSIFSGMLIILIIAPFLKTHKNFKKAGFTGLGLAAFLLTLSVLVYMVIYPYPVSIENFLPMYQMARMISYGRFFQRIESVFLFVWALAALLYLSFIMFLAIHVFTKTFKLKYYRPLIPPFAIIIFTLSLLSPNLVTAIHLETEIFINSAWAVAYALPLLVLITASVVKNRKRGEKRNGKT